MLILLWLISGVALGGRGKGPTFRVPSALSAADEPALRGGMLPGGERGAIGPGIVVAYIIRAYAFNLTAALAFRRHGLLAAALPRPACYLVWHVAYGNFPARARGHGAGFRPTPVAGQAREVTRR